MVRHADPRDRRGWRFALHLYILNVAGLLGFLSGALVNFPASVVGALADDCLGCFPSFRSVKPGLLKKLPPRPAVERSVLRNSCIFAQSTVGPSARRPVVTVLTVLTVLTALTAATVATAQAVPIRPGEVVERVSSPSAPGQSYAVYLPKSYSADRTWPVLFLMDPRGRALVPLELLRPPPSDSAISF